MIRLVMESFSAFPNFPIIAVSFPKVSNTNNTIYGYSDERVA
jgi:hypothetical protein